MSKPRPQPIAVVPSARSARPTLGRGRWLALLATLSLLATVPGHAAPPAAERPADADCFVCHGALGQGNQAVGGPQLAGMPAWYLRGQLEAFQTGQRGTHADDPQGNAMRAIALALPDATTTTRIADTFAAMPPRSTPATIAGDVGRGGGLYGTCGVCHGDSGEGNAALGAPPLLHLNDWYIVAQLNNYRAGRRGDSADDKAGAEMRAASALLDSEQAIRDVTAYIATRSGAQPVNPQPQEAR